MHYVYFLKLSNGDIYTGYSDDLKRRIPEHKSGKVKSTKNYLPCTLIGYEAYLEKDDALRRERYLKTTEGKRFFNQQFKEVLKKLGSSRHYKIVKSFSLLKKTALAFFISIPITFLSSLIKYGDSYVDGFNYIGFPFWREKSGGFAGILVYDNLAPLKNFMFWFVLIFTLLFLFTFLFKRFKRY
ncbi:MAG: GIY-YIG nuclease family protein [Candidatus Levybacteria bacterium]|nr:GIY-YIG nuclease family protein [Candidatus Levybacteria bacterium]